MMSPDVEFFGEQWSGSAGEAGQARTRRGVVVQAWKDRMSRGEFTHRHGRIWQACQDLGGEFKARQEVAGVDSNGLAGSAMKWFEQAGEAGMDRCGSSRSGMTGPAKARYGSAGVD